ncbi:MAG: amidase family protein, partial [Oscillospiraceae bacterium]
CLASGQTSLSLGSDTGGSIRQPASYCGLVGLKPTYGVVSRYGLVAFSSSLDQIGPIARTTKDLAMLFSVISGKDKRDATSINNNFGNYENLLNKDLSGITIGLPKEYFGKGINNQILESIDNCVKILAQNGVKFKQISMPMLDYSLAVYYTISCAEASSNLARFDGVKYGYSAENAKSIKELFKMSRTEGFGEEVKRRIMLGNFVLASGHSDNYYKKAIALQKQIKANYINAFKDVDLIITPTVPNVAFNIGSKTSDPMEMYMEDICTITSNIAGVPSLSLPCGLNKEKMPIGLQLIGPNLSEALILSLTLKIENLLGGFNKVVKIENQGGN